MRDHTTAETDIEEGANAFVEYLGDTEGSVPDHCNKVNGNFFAGGKSCF